MSAFITSKDSTLDGSAICDSLIRVDALGRFLAKVVLQTLGIQIEPPSDEDDSINILCPHVGILENLLNRLQCLVEQVYIEFLELGAGKSLQEVVAVFKALDLDLDALLT